MRGRRQPPKPYAFHKVSVSSITPPSSLIQFIAIKPPIVRRSLLHRPPPNIHIHTILLPWRRRFLETIAAILELWVGTASSAPVRGLALGVVRSGQISARGRASAGWGLSPCWIDARRFRFRERIVLEGAKYGGAGVADVEANDSAVGLRGEGMGSLEFIVVMELCQIFLPFCY